MSPEITKGKSIEEGIHKFVRVCKKIAYGSIRDTHKDIAIEQKLIESQRGKPLVDDAGYLRHIAKKIIYVSEQTTSCNIPWNRYKEERDITINLLQETTSLEVEKE